MNRESERVVTKVAVASTGQLLLAVLVCGSTLARKATIPFGFYFGWDSIRLSSGSSVVLSVSLKLFSGNGFSLSVPFFNTTK